MFYLQLNIISELSDAHNKEFVLMKSLLNIAERLLKLQGDTKHQTQLNVGEMLECCDMSFRANK